MSGRSASTEEDAKRKEAADTRLHAELARLRADGEASERLALLDHFAGIALPVMLARGKAHHELSDVARASYNCADAMMAERERRMKP